MNQSSIMSARRAGLEPGQLTQRLGPVPPPRPVRPKVRRVLAPLGHRQRTDRAALPASESKQNHARMPAKNDQEIAAPVKSWGAH